MMDATIAPLFEPLAVSGLNLPNRIAMAPMTRRMVAEGDRGVPTPAMVGYYARRAEGGVGLIITEGTAIDDRHAFDTPTVPGIWSEDHVAAWRRVTDAVHAAGDGRSTIALQLWHTGRHGSNPIAPSPIAAPNRGGGFKPTPREMTPDDLRQVKDAFVRGAANARHAGFDAVEVHGAHGYLLESFVSPATNQRRDEYGGSAENRRLYPLEIVRALRAELGAQFPIIYRFSQWKVEDPNAIIFHDAEALGEFVRALSDAGVTMLHASTANAVEPAFAGSTLTLAGWARELSGLPTIAVGRVSVSSSMNDTEPVQVTDPRPAAELIVRGEADLVAVGRALIANPDWPKVVRAGRWRELKPYSRELLGSLT